MTKHTNRFLALLLCTALGLGLLSGCGEQPQPSAEPSETSSPSPTASEPPEESSPAPVTESSAVELAELIFPYSGCKDPDSAQRLNSEEDADILAFYVENAYKLEEGTWKDAAVIRATGASAFEVAVLRLTDEDTAARTTALLGEYRTDREGDFTGYAPDQADMVHDGAVEQNGAFVGLFLCPEPGLASAAFAAVLKGDELPALPEPAEPSEAPSEPPSEPPSESPSEAPSEAPSEVPSESPSAAPSEMPSEPPLETPVETPSETPSETPAEAPSMPPGELHTEVIIEPPVESPSAPVPVEWPGRLAYIPPTKDDMTIYDTSAIRAAWAAGDPSWLSEYDRAIYSAAQNVLTQILTPGMTDYEKEKAIYQWMVLNVNYDWTHNNVLTYTPRESYTPYGGLVNQTAVCLGYATSFQLLCDLAGVECITIAGAAASNRDNHGWNMVRLGGNWYCLDVTWDADWRERGKSNGLPASWRYFNVTSDRMAATDHQWDYVNTPEAVTEGNGG